MDPLMHNFSPHDQLYDMQLHLSEPCTSAYEPQRQQQTVRHFQSAHQIDTSGIRSDSNSSRSQLGIHGQRNRMRRVLSAPQLHAADVDSPNTSLPSFDDILEAMTRDITRSQAPQSAQAQLELLSPTIALISRQCPSASSCSSTMPLKKPRPIPLDHFTLRREHTDEDPAHHQDFSPSLASLTGSELPALPSISSPSNRLTELDKENRRLHRAIEELQAQSRVLLHVCAFRYCPGLSFPYALYS